MIFDWAYRTIDIGSENEWSSFLSDNRYNIQHWYGTTPYMNVGDAGQDVRLDPDTRDPYSTL